MADPEIKLVFNAETGKASKNIQDLYNKILNLEKNRGSDFTDKEIRKINDLIETYAKYEHKVTKFNEYIRQINATEFSNETVRDKTLENAERKFQIILGYGTQIAAAMREIGIQPRALDGYVNLASTLSVADKELDVAFRNKERLLKQPTAPKGALVTSHPWENEASPDNPETPKQQFKNRYSAVAADIEAYQRTLEVTISSTEKLKAAFREKYAALKETDEGYIQQKQLLESLMVTTDRQLLSLEKLRGGVQGQIADLEQLYKTTSDNKHWLTGLKSLEERATSVAEMHQKVDIAAQNSINIQNKYNNTQFKANEKATKAEEKYQASLATTGMTYQELTQLYSQLLAARAKAQTPEQIQAIDRHLTAVRKSITLMGREAQLSGAKMIGAQTSVLGVMQQVVSQWRNGTLTLKGLTQGIKLFAKSTLVLAAIQFAWEGISWAMDKAKTAIFGTAEAEEKAAQKAQALADAAKEASDNLLNAQHELVAARADKAREDAAKKFAEQLRLQNEEYREQIKLINETLAANLSLAASIAKDEEKDIALEKLRLQEEKMKGLITEYEYQEKLIDLETRASENRRAAEIDRKAFAKDAAEEKLKLAREAETDASDMAIESMVGFDLTSEEVQVQIAAYKELKAEVEKYRDEYMSLKKDEADYLKTAEEMRAVLEMNPNNEFARYDLAEAESKLESIKNYEEYENRMNQAYRDIPEMVRKYGLDGRSLSQYNRERDSRLKYNEETEKQQEAAREEVRRAEEAFYKAADELNAAQLEAAEAASREGELATQRIGMIRWQRDNAEYDKKMQKKIDSAKKRIKKMEFSYLQRQEKEMRAWAEQYNEDTPEGKRRRSLASVYTSEYKSRVEAGQDASNRVVQQGIDAKGKAATVVNLAGELANKSTLDKKVDLDAVISVLGKAIKTKSLADDAAAMELYNLVQRLMTVAQKNSKDARTLKQKYTALARKLSDPSR